MGWDHGQYSLLGSLCPSYTASDEHSITWGITAQSLLWWVGTFSVPSWIAGKSSALSDAAGSASPVHCSGWQLHPHGGKSQLLQPQRLRHKHLQTVWAKAPPTLAVSERARMPREVVRWPWSPLLWVFTARGSSSKWCSCILHQEIMDFKEKVATTAFSGILHPLDGHLWSQSGPEGNLQHSPSSVSGCQHTAPQSALKLGRKRQLLPLSFPSSCPTEF